MGKLREKADAGKLTIADLSNGTFSISSVGNLGGQTFVPVIYRPQVCIIAIGRSMKKPKYVEDHSHPDGYKFVPYDAVRFIV